MWTKGSQNLRLEYSSKRINEEVLEHKGYLQDEDAKILLYKFLRNNIGYTSELFLGVRMFSFQEMLIKSMMIADTCMMVLSRGMSKSFSAAIYLLF